MSNIFAKAGAAIGSATDRLVEASKSGTTWGKRLLDGPNRVKGMGEELDHVWEAISANQTAITGLQNDVRQLKALEGRITRFEESVPLEVATGLSPVNGRMDALEAKLDRMIEAVSKIEGRSEALAGRFAVFGRSLKGLNGKAESFEAQFEGISQSIKSLKEKVAALKSPTQ